MKTQSQDSLSFVACMPDDATGHWSAACIALFKQWMRANQFKGGLVGLRLGYFKGTLTLAILDHSPANITDFDHSGAQVAQ